MAIESDVYGTVVRVQAQIGDIVDNRQFTKSTQPSLDEVEQAINDIGASINLELKQQGYTVPVVLADDKQAFNFLAFANTSGASAAILSYQPFEAGPGGFSQFSDDAITSRRNYYQSILKRAFELIRDNELPAARDVNIFANVVSGSRLDDEGNVKLPLFTRGMFDNPGSRSLTE